MSCYREDIERVNARLFWLRIVLVALAATHAVAAILLVPDGVGLTSLFLVGVIVGVLLVDGRHR